MSLTYEPASEPLHISVKQLGLTVVWGTVMQVSPTARPSNAGAALFTYIDVNQVASPT